MIPLNTSGCMADTSMTPSRLATSHIVWEVKRHRRAIIAYSECPFFGLDHRIGHPIPLEPIPLLVVEDSGEQGGFPLTPGSQQTSTEASAGKISPLQSSHQHA